MSASTPARRFLNVGGNSKKIPLPAGFETFEHVMLDIDPQTSPDVLCDGRELQTLALAQFDAVYCSHNLEHYYRHDVKKVLAGFLHVLKPGGFAYIVVPDVMTVMKMAVEKNLDIDDVLYVSSAGPIMVLDVLYGYGLEIEQRGVDFFSHKTGFSGKSLNAALMRAGFALVYKSESDLQITAIAFKGPPRAEFLTMFNLPVPTPV